MNFTCFEIFKINTINLEKGSILGPAHIYLAMPRVYIKITRSVMILII
jgi:hypothetical protein